MYAVIMAGGGGTRLWPLSRPETPKPFLPLLDDESLLRRTVARIVGHAELDLQPEDVAVVTERRYGPMVREQLPGVHVIAEPLGRNTAAAIALATLRF
jgi:mannose-1-phosphate guanylyltransferase